MQTGRLIHAGACAALGAMLFLVSGRAAADGNAWSGPAKVTEIRAGFANGDVYVSGLPTVSSCANPTIHFDSRSDSNKILSLAMAAQLSGKRFQCWVSTSTCDSDGNQIGYFCKIVN